VFEGVIVISYFVSLVQLETGEFCTANFNTWKLEGFVRFNISKDGGCEYCEVLLFLR
jgi:hypothetical protein